MLSVVLLNCYAECHYAQCRYAQCRHAQCRGSKYSQVAL
jgi:hypothetical protein